MTLPTSVTVLSAEMGVYTHTPTGFTLHDIYSVADAISLNGVMAIDAGNDAWAWVAGEDLSVEVFQRNKKTLSALAHAVIEQRYQLEHERFAVRIQAEKDGQPAQSARSVPGIRVTTVAASPDLRIFGIVTNVQAGRGCSPAHINAVAANAGIGQCGLTTVSTAFPPSAPNLTTPFLESFSSVGGGTLTFVPPASVIGRVIVTIPTGTWATFLEQWKSNVPHVDQSEVATKADEAIASFSASVLPNLYDIPFVRVPLILTSTGGAYIDQNDTPSCYKSTGSSLLPDVVYHNPFLAPALPKQDGIWITNPVAMPPTIAIRQFTRCVENLGRDPWDCLQVSPGSFADSDYTLPCSKITAIDGVELFKILGGLYPRTDVTPTSFSLNAAVSRVMNHNHMDSDPAPQGAMTGPEYDSALSATFAASSYGHERFVWGHWWMAGQPIIVASIMLDAGLVGKTVRGDIAIGNFSGHICSGLRAVADGATLLPLASINAVTSASTFFRHQHSTYLEA